MVGVGRGCGWELVVGGALGVVGMEEERMGRGWNKVLGPLEEVGEESSLVEEAVEVGSMFDVVCGGGRAV